MLLYIGLFLALSDMGHHSVLERKAVDVPEVAEVVAKQTYLHLALKYVHFLIFALLFQLRQK